MLGQIIIFSILFNLVPGNTISRSGKIEVNPFTPNGRIVGGEPITIEKVPHHVALEAGGISFCGGSIISNKWILTAGHCVADTRNLVTIRAGTNQLNSSGTVHSVARTIRHENYKINKFDIPENDIGLVELITPMVFNSKQRAIPLFRENEKSIVGAMSEVTGWGRTQVGGTRPLLLQRVKVPIVSQESCNSDYEEIGGLPWGQICAAFPEGGKDACQGDSGGPLTIKGRLAGIVSWGTSCALKGNPGVYTEIASYRNWIARKTGL